MTIVMGSEKYVPVNGSNKPYAVYRREGCKHSAYAVFTSDGRLLCLTEYLVGAVTVTLELNRLKEGGTANGNQG